MNRLETLPHSSSTKKVSSRLSQNDTRYSYIVKLSDSKQTSTEFKSRDRYSLEKLQHNKRKLRYFRTLKENWNGYDGQVIEEKTIQKIDELITHLEYQPQIFPTGRGTLQLEGYIDDENYYEIEVLNDSANVYIVKNNEEIESESIDFEKTIQLINEFYTH